MLHEVGVLFRTCSWKNDARLVVLMVTVLAFALDTNDVVADAGAATNANMIVKGSPEDASESSGRSFDSEFVCWYWRTLNVARCKRTTT